MKPVAEYSKLCSGVFAWQGFETVVKCDCSSSALVTQAGLVFIDPIPLAEAALKELIVESFSAPCAVVITSGNHQRESLGLAKQLGIPVFAPEEAGLDIMADKRFLSSESIAGMESIPLPGFGPGETALLHEDVLIFGDALINLEPEGLRLLPEKYRIDSRMALRSIASLLNLSPGVMLFAHGNPIVQNAAQRLESSLSDQVTE
jgi:hypothetical protein